MRVRSLLAIIGATCAVVSLVSCSAVGPDGRPVETCGPQAVGTIGGGALGGIAGAALTHGGVLGTVAGVVGGGLIGNALTATPCGPHPDQNQTAYGQPTYVPAQNGGTYWPNGYMGSQPRPAHIQAPPPPPPPPPYGTQGGYRYSGTYQGQVSSF